MMGRDGWRRDDWGRGSHYNHYRGYGHNMRRYEWDDRHYDNRHGGYGYGYGYGERDHRDYYRRDGDYRGGYGRGGGGGGWGGYRGRGGRRDGFRGGQDQRRTHDRDEIDPEEMEYIRKRQEVLKQRREKEENYVPEDVDTEALAAMGLPTGFGPPQKIIDGEGGEQKDNQNGDVGNGDHKILDEKSGDGECHHQERRRRSRDQSEEREEKRMKLDEDAAVETEATTSVDVSEGSCNTENKINVVKDSPESDSAASGQTEEAVDTGESESINTIHVEVRGEILPGIPELTSCHGDEFNAEEKTDISSDLGEHEQSIENSAE